MTKLRPFKASLRTARRIYEKNRPPSSLSFDELLQFRQRGFCEALLSTGAVMQHSNCCLPHSNCFKNRLDFQQNFPK